MRLLRLFNRQKSRKLSVALLRRLARHLLEESLALRKYELGVHLIDAFEMTKLNETFLGHAGSTDVITFNHREPADGGDLHGEIFISVDDAVAQAGRFGATWQSEVVRYLAHGILHLEGHDDTEIGPRRAMKREENKLVKELSRRFDLGKLGRVKNASKWK
jgi:probable rRNA maturation factor